MDKTTIHKQITDKMHKTYQEKNADYGDSFAKVRQKVPNAILVRLMDKINRIENLLGKEESAKVDESLDDSYLDLANYCVMEVVEREVDKSLLTMIYADE